MINKLKRKLRKEQFYPSLLGIFINPFYIARKGLWKELESLSCHIHGRVLDIGCGQKPWAPLFRCDEYIGLELDTRENRIKKKADIFYDGNYIPVDDSSFDFVFLSQVFEHVFNPETFLAELYRVLKPGGGILMTAPFVWAEHEQPFDYARYSSFGLTHILEKNGFKIIIRRKTVSDVRVIFQLINVYLFSIVNITNTYIKYFICILLTAPFNLMGELCAKILPNTADLYLDNIILARKVNK